MKITTPCENNLPPPKKKTTIFGCLSHLIIHRLTYNVVNDISVFLKVVDTWKTSLAQQKRIVALWSRVHNEKQSPARYVTEQVIWKSLYHPVSTGSSTLFSREAVTLHSHSRIFRPTTPHPVRAGYDDSVMFDNLISTNWHLAVLSICIFLIINNVRNPDMFLSHLCFPWNVCPIFCLFFCSFIYILFAE